MPTRQNKPGSAAGFLTATLALFAASAGLSGATELPSAAQQENRLVEISSLIPGSSLFAYVYDAGGASTENMRVQNNLQITVSLIRADGTGILSIKPGTQKAVAAGLCVAGQMIGIVVDEANPPFYVSCLQGRSVQIKTRVR